MLRHYNDSSRLIFRIHDATVVAGVWLLAFWLRFYVPLVEVTKGFPTFSTYASLTPVVVLIWLAVFSSQHLYHPKTIERRTHEAWRVVRAHILAMLCFVFLTYLFSEYRYSRVVMVYFGFISGFVLIYGRLAIRNSIRGLRRRGIGTLKTVILGSGELADVLETRLKKFPELGMNVVRRINPADFSSHDGFLKALHEHRANQIVIALSQDEQHRQPLGFWLDALKNEIIEIQIIPDLSQFTALGCQVEDFGGVPVINLNETPLSGASILLKRMTDFILSSVALVLFSPVLILVALLVKLTSRGPILYRQERMGLDGRTFGMLKFRSMRIDAEEKTGAVWATKADDRKTAIGGFLRSTSIDELPQLWNVWKGEMSLVGPRPERPVFVHQFKNQIPHYMLRHKVKAGVTGWAQVNGWRGDTSLDRRIECDLYYIRNWSYFLDWKILVLTVFKGFIHKNAY